MFAQQSDIMNVLMMAVNMPMGDDLDEDELDSRQRLRDNSISCLAKICLFQNDLSGSKVSAELL